MIASLAPRRLGLLLVGSLLLNLLLIGIIAGHFLFAHRPSFPPGDFAARVSRGMSDADAKVMEAAFRPVEEFREHMRQGRGLIGRSRELLREPSFDPEAFARLISEASRNREEFDQRFSAALIEAASKLSPEGRQKLGDHRP
jgi:uncharacterized membrane protein